VRRSGCASRSSSGPMTQVMWGPHITFGNGRRNPAGEVGRVRVANRDGRPHRSVLASRLRGNDDLRERVALVARPILRERVALVARPILRERVALLARPILRERVALLARHFRQARVPPLPSSPHVVGGDPRHAGFPPPRE